MRRADRLFQLVQYLRRRGVVTARQLSRRAGGLGAHDLPRRSASLRPPACPSSRRPASATACAATTCRPSRSPATSWSRWRSACASSTAGPTKTCAAAARRALAKIEAVLPEGHEQMLHDDTAARAEEASPRRPARRLHATCARRFAIAARSASTTPTPTAPRRGACCVRSASPSTARCGFSPRGASCAGTTAPSDPTAWPPWTSSTRSSIPTTVPSMDGFLCQIIEQS